MSILSMNATTLQTWFERDRQHIALVDKDTEQNTLIEWWDESATEAIEDGFLDMNNLHESVYRCYAGQ